MNLGIPLRRRRTKSLSLSYISKASAFFLAVAILVILIALYHHQHSLCHFSVLSADSLDMLINQESSSAYRKPDRVPTHSLSSTARKPGERPSKCTVEELFVVRDHLRPLVCAASAIKDPCLQKCSITIATKCPDTSNYLEEYYKVLQKQYLKSSEPNEFESFVGLSIGCNKGFDALNTLRMGTFDGSLSKEEWKTGMLKDGELGNSVCAQDTTNPFSVDMHIIEPRKGVVHCFEPVPSTVKKLKELSKDLGYDKKGLKVIHAAVDKEPGTAFFKSSDVSGLENHGLGLCLNQKLNEEGCDQEVEVLTLANYVKENIPGDGPIHILQIDVEGYDNNVLLGAKKEVLERVEYLEFEYNWMGPWGTQHLYDTIETLDDLDITCYWVGQKKLWRITGCWQLYFDIHTWSNVACVNRRMAPDLAEKMEEVFQQTLKIPYLEIGFTQPVTKKLREDLSPRRAAMAAKAVSIDPDIMTAKYLQ